ncbi:MAG: hypothetical protein HY815_01050 [Candidatus Riflebacteria bacterium]|nr:hypothetical protein [Candidatus Riflebacteria bacterium]
MTWAQALPPTLYVLVGLVYLNRARPKGEALWVIGLFLVQGAAGFVSLLVGRSGLSQGIVALGLVAILGREWWLWRSRDLDEDFVQKLLRYFFALFAIQTFNPNWSTVSTGLLCAGAGLVLHVLPMGLYWTGRRLGRDTETVEELVRCLLVVFALQAGYGVAQMALGKAHVASLGPGFAEVLTREELYTPFDLLQPISFCRGTGELSQVCWIGTVLAVAAALRTSGLPALAWLGLSAVGLVCQLATFVRVWLVAVAGCLTLLVARRPRHFLMAATVTLISLAAAHVVTHGVTTRRLSSVVRFSALTRSRGSSLVSFAQIVQRFPLGAGPGRAGAAGPYFKGAEDRIYTFSIESYPVALWLESGPLGLAAMVWALWLVGLGAWASYRTADDPQDMALACLVLGFLGAALVAPVGHGQPGNLVLWLLAGVISCRGGQGSHVLSPSSTMTERPRLAALNLPGIRSAVDENTRRYQRVHRIPWARPAVLSPGRGSRPSLPHTHRGRRSFPTLDVPTRIELEYTPVQCRDRDRRAHPADGWRRKRFRSAARHEGLPAGAEAGTVLGRSGPGVGCRVTRPQETLVADARAGGTVSSWRRRDPQNGDRSRSRVSPRLRRRGPASSMPPGCRPSVVLLSGVA